MPLNQSSDIQKYPTKASMLEQLNYSFIGERKSSVNMDMMYAILQERDADVEDVRYMSRSDVRRALVSEFSLPDNSMNLNTDAVKKIYSWAYNEGLIKEYTDNVTPIVRNSVRSSNLNSGSGDSAIDITGTPTRRQAIQYIQERVVADTTRHDSLSRETIIRLYKSIKGVFPIVGQSKNDMLADIVEYISGVEIDESWTPRKNDYVTIYNRLEDIDDAYTGEPLYQACPVCGDGPVNVQQVRSGEGFSFRGDGCIKAKYSGSPSGKVYEHKSLCN